MKEFIVKDGENNIRIDIYLSKKDKEILRLKFKKKITSQSSFKTIIYSSNK